MTDQEEMAQAQAAMAELRSRERTDRWHAIIPRRFVDATLDGIEDMNPESEA